MKEPFCALSHGVGALLALGGLAMLLVLARGRRAHTVSFAIYGVSLVTLYVASTLYHALRAPAHVEVWLQRADFSAIFLLIAGSYTPFCMVMLRGAWGKTILGVVWTLAILGIAATLGWHTAPAWTRIVLYIGMGWMGMVALKPLRERMAPEGVAWLIAGGLVYSAGTVIFVLNQPSLWPGHFGALDLWHLFVMGGSACHFVTMARYIATIDIPHTDAAPADVAYTDVSLAESPALA